ncbi:MAG TPA: SGNH/GDSL hydrolase family protein [Patescibacteria group bacterium]
MQVRPVLLVLIGLWVSALAKAQIMTNAQVQVEYNWWDPTANSFPVIDGQAWPGEVQAPYDRFPARAEKTLNPDVWDLSHNSAGLYIKFKTNAEDLVVRYVLKGNRTLPHMPTTGVSGVDLYAIDLHGNWVWAPGRFTFGDTVEYRFPSLKVGEGAPEKDFEYRLYLPLYNGVQWLRIGTPKGRKFNPMPLSPEKPVVVYGTSIAQGGCTSRPGLAWTSILQRKLDLPLYNFGFSGKGKLESSVIDLITEIDAKLYVLDCLPNMTPSGGFSAEEVEKRVVAAVKEIRLKRPSTPILLVEHSGGRTDRIIDTSIYNNFSTVNKTSRKVFARLMAEGIKGLYTLSSDEIGLGIDATVDGVHPNDFGMIQYADAYEKKIRFILDEPSDSLSTTIPVVQSRDFYNWRKRHQEIIALNKREPPRNVILGNSIIHFWGGRPVAEVQRGQDSWDKYLEPAGLRNLAYGWDRIENVLWRVYHDELDGYAARHVIIMIGTNNLGINSDPEIIAGLKRLIQAVKVRQPSATILLSGILPRQGMEERIVLLNKNISRLAADRKLVFIDPGKVLLTGKGKIDESLFSDGLHPNAAGYERLAPVLASYLTP